MWVEVNSLPVNTPDDPIILPLDPYHECLVRLLNVLKRKRTNCSNNCLIAQPMAMFRIFLLRGENDNRLQKLLNWRLFFDDALPQNNVEIYRSLFRWR